MQLFLTKSHIIVTKMEEEMTLPACIRCKYSYTTIHSTLMQCKMKERIPKYFKTGECSTQPYLACKYYKFQLKRIKRYENSQTMLNFDM